MVTITGGENRSSRRKPPTFRKSLTIFITQCCIEYTLPWEGFELRTLVVIGTDCTGICKSTYPVITTTMAPVPVNLTNILACIILLLHVISECDKYLQFIIFFYANVLAISFLRLVGYNRNVLFIENYVQLIVLWEIKWYRITISPYLMTHQQTPIKLILLFFIITMDYAFFQVQKA